MLRLGGILLRLLHGRCFVELLHAVGGLVEISLAHRLISKPRGFLCYQRTGLNRFYGGIVLACLIQLMLHVQFCGRCGCTNSLPGNTSCAADHSQRAAFVRMVETAFLLDCGDALCTRHFRVRQLFKGLLRGFLQNLSLTEGFCLVAEPLLLLLCRSIRGFFRRL